jgi:3-oxoadipate enol-lactonase
MPEKATAADGYRASNGIFYRLEGNGEPLLLLHGALAAGAMFDPLIALLRDRFRMLVPDLRGHGNSSPIGAPYDVATLAGDLDAVLAEAEFARCGVMGYSHGGAVAQQFAHARPDAVSRLMLVCTYARNVSTLRERLECEIFLALLRAVGTRAMAKLIFRPSSPSSTGPVGLTPEQCEWMRSMVARNDVRAMCGVVRGLIAFDSRHWLKEIKPPTLVIGGTHDHAVPRHHFDTLTQGISSAKGRLVERADHTLVWTHTRELATLMRGD